VRRSAILLRRLSPLLAVNLGPPSIVFLAEINDDPEPSVWTPQYGKISHRRGSMLWY
jgi:hypothetical protein